MYVEEYFTKHLLTTESLGNMIKNSINVEMNDNNIIVH